VSVYQRKTRELTSNNGLSECQDVGIGVDNVLDDAFDAILEQESIPVRAATYGIVGTNLR
jgi:hypothetical protein